jgi:arylsulfatase A-like enzyme
VLADDAVSFINDAGNLKNHFSCIWHSMLPMTPDSHPKEFVDMYPLRIYQCPINFQPLYPYREEMGSGENLRDERLAPFPRTEYAVKVNRQEYYAIITHMDKQIGIILDELEKSGKADNTYIFFTSDHGLAVGEHGLLGNRTCMITVFVSRLLLQVRIFLQTTEVSADIYYQDVMASSLDIAGVEKPEYVSLTVLWTLHRGEGQNHFTMPSMAAIWIFKE